ncbi:MAG: CopG family transcriptional regulator [Desulfobacterales bacterium]|nr:CopG family transcriptional regulator [Desulfobacterales bacterium]
METSRIAICIDNDLLNRIDLLVKSKTFPNRSKIFQEAIKEKIEKIERVRLYRECLKLDSDSEQKIADEGMESEFVEWEKY